MPRYFFHVLDDRAIIDYDGMDLDGVPDVRREALRRAGALLTVERNGLLHGRPWRMSVVDAADDVVYSLVFEADHHGY